MDDADVTDFLIGQTENKIDDINKKLKKKIKNIETIMKERDKVIESVQGDYSNLEKKMNFLEEELKKLSEKFEKKIEVFETGNDVSLPTSSTPGDEGEEPQIASTDSQKLKQKALEGNENEEYQIVNKDASEDLAYRNVVESGEKK